MKTSLFVRSAMAAGLLSIAGAVCADTIKIAFVEGMSGPFGPIGQNIMKSYELIIEKANKEAWSKGNKFEIVAFDTKNSPQEALTQLKAVVDQGIRYVAQGNSSAVAYALSDAITKHNERNPGKEIIFLNNSAVDPDLTNAKCSFWHFRFDANSDQKMEALTTWMTDQKDIKNVYLIGQNYSFGVSVANAAKSMLARKRSDIKIVGEDLHPIMQVKDFSPYIAKMKAAGTDTVITGNWGIDLALLIKAAKDADFKANFFTFYAGTTGVPTALGASGEGKVHYVGYWAVNEPTMGGKDIATEFLKRYNDDYYVMATYSVIKALAEASNKAKSVDPVKVAFAMEDMKFKSLNGEVQMRGLDHQLQQPLVISTWKKVDGKTVKFDQEKQGYGWKSESVQPTYVGVQPSSCMMKRPGKI
jgi:branched-chain amino acid transport system substrate-binding protein